MLEEAGGKGDVELSGVGVDGCDEIFVGGNDGVVVQEEKGVERGVVHAFYLSDSAELVVDDLVTDEVLPKEQRFVGVVG